MFSFRGKCVGLRITSVEVSGHLPLTRNEKLSTEGAFCYEFLLPSFPFCEKVNGKCAKFSSAQEEMR